MRKGERERKRERHYMSSSHLGLIRRLTHLRIRICILSKAMRVKREVTLTHSKMLDLLGMPPFFWQAPFDVTDKSFPQTRFRLSVKVLLRAYRRGEEAPCMLHPKTNDSAISTQE